MVFGNVKCDTQMKGPHFNNTAKNKTNKKNKNKNVRDGAGTVGSDSSGITVPHLSAILEVAAAFYSRLC